MIHQESSFFNMSPIQLLQKIVGAVSERGSSDARANLTLHFLGGRSWTGIPYKFLQASDGAFVGLKFRDKRQIVMISMNQFCALEVEDPDLLEQFFSKPWLSDARYSSITKFQLVREIEALSKELGKSIQFKFDSLPLAEDSPGAALAWLNLLVTEYKKLCLDDFGKAATKEIDIIEIIYKSEPLSFAKSGRSLQLSFNITPESFNEKVIFDGLNSSL